MFDTDAGFQGFNLFVYCGNNPIFRVDISGKDSEKVDDLDIVEDEVSLFGGGGLSAIPTPTPQPMKTNLLAELLDILDLLIQSFKDASGGLSGEFRKTPYFDQNQQAVIALAKENKDGLSRADAEVLVSWAEEYGINNHMPAVHKNRSGIWSEKVHIKIHKYHIVVLE